LCASDNRLCCPSLRGRSECRFFDDDVRKGQFHCAKCGICRVGGRDNFFHVRLHSVLRPVPVPWARDWRRNNGHAR
jgi:hypothetical protein